MLSVGRCRKILGNNHSLSDAQVIDLRDRLSQLAGLALDLLDEVPTDEAPDRLRASRAESDDG